MKKNIILLLGVLLAAVAIWSCASLIDCEEIRERHAFILMDVSDKALFRDIENDLKSNFPGFMQRTGLGNIAPCECFTFSFAHFGGKETLKIASRSIAINRKGLSRDEERRLANPTPLVQLMRTKIDEYNKLTDDREIISNTNIANVLIKTINQAEPSADNIFLLFTDGVENSQHLNLYRDKPANHELGSLLTRMIEPAELEKFRLLRDRGLQAEIVMVLKSEPTKKVDRRYIKTFWINIFEQLQLPYQFVDNLSNQVEI